MNQSKIEAIKSQLDNPKLKDKTKTRFKDLLQQTEEDRTEYKNRMISVFDTIYDFSKVYFIPDYLFDDFLSGKRNGVFYNNEGDIDDNIEMREDYYLLAYRGKDDYELTMHNMEGKRTRNIPNIFSLIVFSRVFKIFIKETKEFKDGVAEQMVLKVTKRFNEYLNR